MDNFTKKVFPKRDFLIKIIPKGTYQTEIQISGFTSSKTFIVHPSSNRLTTCSTELFTYDVTQLFTGPENNAKKIHDLEYKHFTNLEIMETMVR